MRKKCIWNWNWHARKEIEYWDEWGKWHGFFTALSFIGSIIFIIGIPIPYLIEYFLSYIRRTLSICNNCNTVNTSICTLYRDCLL